MSNLIVDFPRQSHQQCHPHEPVSPCGNMLESNPLHISKKRRAVRFSPTSMLHAYEVLEAQDSSTSSSSSSWYSHEEEQQFKRRTRQEIMLFRKMKQSGGDHNILPIKIDLCPVGLEQHLMPKEFNKKRAITRRMVVLAVLTEQARPIKFGYEEGEGDKWERIANASRIHSEWSKAQAQTIGNFQATSM